MNSEELSRSDALWELLKHAPVTEEDDEVVISEPFLHFPAGTGITTVWAWFEAIDPTFSVALKLYGKRASLLK